VGTRAGGAGAGIVYLVGAGPGDPELLTLRGRDCLRRAQVVVYDRLVSLALLDEAPPWAERIYVGKRRGVPHRTQEEINALLVERALAGQVVVRLKGGDPFVFGRGAEEVEACARAGVAWEVVPGVSSAVAAPAAAGIPVTHRRVAAGFAVVTAERAADAPEPDWEAYARMPTLVVLMGVAGLSDVAERLLRHGRAAETPAAIVERATLPDQRVTVATLGEIASRAAEVGVRAPAVLVVGEVVALRREASVEVSDPSVSVLLDLAS
jgi:uroporphyrin-III C-methyltransferase